MATDPSTTPESEENVRPSIPGSDTESSLVPAVSEGDETGLIAASADKAKSIAERISAFGKDVASEAAKKGQAIAQQAKERGQDALEATTDLAAGAAKKGQAIAQEAGQTGQSALKATSELGGAAVKRGRELVGQATVGAGKAVDFVEDTPPIRSLTKAFKLDWLVGASDQIDVKKVAESVRSLQTQYPDESPRQISQRIILQKSMLAGALGLANSAVPGEAIALLAVNLATTAALQTEMLYQIAAAYGLDLTDTTRKGEVLAIFGLALGGTRAIQAGLAFLKSTPFLGMLIGASANAVMLYGLGYAAGQYYEAKLNPEIAETAVATLEAIHHDSESYLDVATAQAAVMDQVLAHMILASYPQKQWEDIVPSLRSLDLDSNSLATIAAHLQTPQPLGALLDQLDQDFAVQTYSCCYAIAQVDGSISPAEAEVLETMRQRFNLDTDAIRQAVENPAIL